MKFSLGSVWSWTMLAVVGAGTLARAEEISLAATGSSLVPGLAVMGDLEPTTDAPASRPMPKPSAYTFGTRARASTPDVDRARSYGSTDPFAGSRVVLPLLVEDLNPSRVAAARPMTGRSVGARPSLPLARPESR